MAHLDDQTRTYWWVVNVLQEVCHMGKCTPPEGHHVEKARVVHGESASTVTILFAFRIPVATREFVAAKLAADDYGVPSLYGRELTVVMSHPK